MNATTVHWKKICAASDIAHELGVCAKIGDQQIAVFRLQDKIYAIHNFDPFSGANVLARGIVGDLKGRDVVASPVYKHHFDLATGECLEDSSVTLPVYAVRTEGEFIEIAC